MKRGRICRGLTKLGMPLGTDRVAKLAEQQKAIAAEAREWHDVAVSTDHDDVAK
jgi:hypothetical protein